ncbi:three-Cys-motif partner protein TcmP [Deinococcus sp. NW-56]|uniref:three-Cys-motif partner protein TcmP n=1 Tax=Deinococcus sp. NW-56 TaxID=2080419 RepID=UPI001319E944|nr:three-Cys-motif partner protein TcmP [Deinococcus sp. NW-56]
MAHRKGHVWTAGKLDFLERYLPAFQLACKQFWPTESEPEHSNTYYVDGFSGPGTNQIGSSVRRGSPLIAASVNPPFRKAYFVEKMVQPYRQLVENLQTPELSDRSDRIEVTRGDFNALVDQILASRRPGLPTFFFLDPEGLELEWSTVEKIGRAGRADLFILISAGGVTRCAGSPPTHGSVTRFYGHEDWRPIADHMDPDHVIGQSKFDAFVQLYLKGLRGLGFDHVERYLVAKNSQNSSMHALVFAAKNRTALKIAEDILRKIEHEQQGAAPLFDI